MSLRRWTASVVGRWCVRPLAPLCLAHHSLRATATISTNSATTPHSSTQQGDASMFTSLATAAAMNELVYRCMQEAKPVPELIKSLSPTTLATLFKHGKGFEGFLRDFGDKTFTMCRREDGVLTVGVTRQGRDVFLSDPVSATKAQELVEQHAHDPQGELNGIIAQVKTAFQQDERAYRPMQEVYEELYPTAEAQEKVKFKDLIQFLTEQVNHFWVRQNFVKLRLESEKEAPPLPVGNYYKVTTAHSGNNYGGWGSLNNVPTATDVFEILKYVPIHWSNMGNLQIPADVKKKHVRTSSFLQWLRRQPKYFEVRLVAGTIEVRRSVLLHPEEHGMTAETAQQWLDARIFAGEHNVVVQNPTPGATNSSASSTSVSAAESAVLKFAQRVCPGYYVPIGLMHQRYTKKNLSFEELHRVIAANDASFETVALASAPELRVYRTRTGTGQKTPSAFLKAIEEFNCDGNALQSRATVAICNHCCALWDRPEYLYVRLSEAEKALVEGFDGMMELMKSKPHIFTVGTNFVRRFDPTNPLTYNSAEPALDDASITMVHVDENPYQTPRDLASVFHYVCPDGAAVPVSHFVEFSSPAMRCVLPPRIMSLIELHPDLFSWRESSPGVFLVKKKDATQHHSSHNSGTADNDGDSMGRGNRGGGGGGGKDNDLMEDDMMSREETVESVVSLVPTEGGVLLSRLELWTSLAVNQAAKQHFGGLRRLIASHPKRFTTKPAPVGSGGDANDLLVCRSAQA